jgi:hypothetical protein
MKLNEMESWVLELAVLEMLNTNDGVHGRTRGIIRAAGGEYNPYSIAGYISSIDRKGLIEVYSETNRRQGKLFRVEPAAEPFVDWTALGITPQQKRMVLRTQDVFDPNYETDAEDSMDADTVLEFVTDEPWYECGNCQPCLNIATLAGEKYIKNVSWVDGKWICNECKNEVL